MSLTIIVIQKLIPERDCLDGSTLRFRVFIERDCKAWFTGQPFEHENRADLYAEGLLTGLRLAGHDRDCLFLEARSHDAAPLEMQHFDRAFDLQESHPDQSLLEIARELAELDAANDAAELARPDHS